MSVFRKNHKSEVLKVLHRGDLVDNLTRLHTDTKEEMEGHLAEIRDLDEDDWGLGFWDDWDRGADWVHYSEIQLGSTNASIIGKPEWEGKWVFDYYYPYLDEFSVCVICEDQGGEEILATRAQSGGTIIRRGHKSEY